MPFGQFFLMPDLTRYPDIRHSYIIELKGKEKNETATI